MTETIGTEGIPVEMLLGFRLREAAVGGDYHTVLDYMRESYSSEIRAYAGQFLNLALDAAIAGMHIGATRDALLLQIAESQHFPMEKKLAAGYTLIGYYLGNKEERGLLALTLSRRLPTPIRTAAKEARALALKLIATERDVQELRAKHQEAMGREHAKRRRGPESARRTKRLH